MKRKAFAVIGGTVLVAAVFLLCPAVVLAGDRVHSNPFRPAAQAPSSQAQPAYASGVRPAALQVAIAVLPPASPPAQGPLYVNLRGPDGQLRRFPVEGGRDAIQVQQVVLRPGQSVTFQWRAAR
jgi:hypothetical protein